MTKTPLLILCTLAAVRVAHADTWTPTTELVPADTAAIRVLEPDGYRFTVDGRSDTAPAVFALANRDQYVVVDAVAPNGAHWTQKIEVRAYTQTVLRLRHEKDAAPAPAAPAAPSFVGVLFNTSHLCKAADRVQLRVDITAANGQVLSSHVLDPRSRKDLTLAGGTYAFRRYLPRNGVWEFAGTQSVTVSKDGWNYEYGCAQ